MEPIISVKGKSVVLTGACGLLGREMARAFSKSGATLFLLDLVPPDEASAQFKKAGVAGTYFTCDITDAKQLATTAKRIGAIDVLINNAAYNPKVESGERMYGFLDYPLDRWEEELRINLTGTMLACRAFRPRMKAGASIINVCSIYGLSAPDQRIYPDGFEKPASYGASKAGVINLTKHLASLWGKDGIRVNAVAFGGVESDQDGTFIKKYSARTPLGRMARPDEIPGILIFLASEASSYATGATFVLDGGWSTW